MDLPKEILTAIEEMTKDADDMDKAADGLFPFHQYEIDGIYEEKIRPHLTPLQSKYFSSVLIKFKHLWYISQNIENLDKQYLCFVSFCIDKKEFRPQHYTKAPPQSSYLYSLYPYNEAIEFENILFQGKACLDCFSIAIGSLFKQKQIPNKIDKLLKDLELVNTNSTASELIDCIQKDGAKLRGYTLDPKIEGKKSVRDLISHRQKAPIQFQIYKNENGGYSTTSGAILDMDHSQIVLMPNYLTKNIAIHIWYYSLKLISNSFKCIAKQYEATKK
jgi:hypothetical protein